MIDLIDHIDGTIDTCLGQGKYYGLCRLLLDDKGLPYPATVKEPSKKVTPNDLYKLLWYHRLIGSSTEVNEDLSFGVSLAVQNLQTVRTVIVSHFSLGETLIDDVINALPDNIENVDYKYIQVSKNITLIRDRDSIWTTEWGNAYKDKYQMRYNIYALEYSIDYIKCSVCVSD